MKNTMILVISAGMTLAACAAHETYYPGGSAQWERLGASRADFATDNQGCGAKASNRTSGTNLLGSMHSGGAVEPKNRIDRAPQPLASAAEDHAYMDCMYGRGWRVVQR
jgi:hypothetical protein